MPRVEACSADADLLLSGTACSRKIIRIRETIVIRFYGVVALYDFLLNRGNAGLVTLTNYLDEYIDSTGEYGEGFGYYNYISSILLPLIYPGMQEQHLSGPNSGWSMKAPGKM